jgi:hypothetical protein
VSGVALHVVPPERLIPPKPPEVPPPIPRKSASQTDQPLPTSKGSPGTQVSPSTSESTPQAPKIEGIQIPSLNARITALQFFEGSPCDEPPLKERAYRQRFAKEITRDVFTEITLEYPKRDQRLDFTIRGVYQRKAPQGKVITRPELRTYLPADSQRSIHSFRSNEGRRILCVGGGTRGGRWAVGSYTVDVLLTGRRSPMAPLRSTSELDACRSPSSRR